MLEALLSRPFTALLIILFLCNVLLHVSEGRWGSALYWLTGTFLMIIVEWLVPLYG